MSWLKTGQKKRVFSMARKGERTFGATSPRKGNLVEGARTESVEPAGPKKRGVAVFSGWETAGKFQNRARKNPHFHFSIGADAARNSQNRIFSEKKAESEREPGKEIKPGEQSPSPVEIKDQKVQKKSHRPCSRRGTRKQQRATKRKGGKKRLFGH